MREREREGNKKKLKIFEIFGLGGRTLAFDLSTLLSALTQIRVQELASLVLYPGGDVEEGKTKHVSGNDGSARWKPLCC